MKNKFTYIYLYFYILFRYEKHAISVRTGSLIDKEEFLDNDMTHYGDALLAIEGKSCNGNNFLMVFIVEPFDFTNTARSVYDDNEFERIVRVFRRSYFTIEKTKTFSSILTEPFD